jgi:hypothetical protein
VFFQDSFGALNVAMAIAHADPSHDLLAVQVVRHADDVRLNHKRMAVQNFFNFAGTAIVFKDKNNF